MRKSPPNLIDMTGFEYPNFKVIRKGTGRYTSGGQYKTTWICKCRCGNEFEADSQTIRRGLKKSCGCMNFTDRSVYSKDLSGQRFGRLTVLRRLNPDEVTTRQYNWLCKCDCGNEIKASANKLKIGHTRSCGCLKQEYSVGDATRTHGMRHTRLYNLYASMKQRCSDPKRDNYKYYGARGIRVCDEWLGEHGFENFYKWAMDNGYDETKPWTEMTIDRINVDGNYEPLNCRWTDSKTQALNKRK